MALQLELASLPWPCALCAGAGTLLETNLLWRRAFAGARDLESCVSGALLALQNARAAPGAPHQIYQATLAMPPDINDSNATDEANLNVGSLLLRFSQLPDARDETWLVAVHPDSEAQLWVSEGEWHELERAVTAGEMESQQDGVAQRVLARQWDAFFAQAATGKALIGMRGETLEVNPALCALVGRSESELLASFARDLRHPDDRARVDACYAAIARGEVLPHVEARYRHRDGHYLTCLLGLSVVRDSRGRALYFAAEVEDISARRRAEAQLRAQTRELERFNAELTRSNAELERFAFVASHDLQEPLRKIRVFGDRLRALLDNEEALAAPDEAARFLDGITRSAERMQNFVNDLLEYGRLQRQEPRRENVDLNELWRDLVEDYADALEGASVEVGELPQVVGDRARLRQLFANLLSNALKFRGADAPHVRVRWLDQDAVNEHATGEHATGENAIGKNAGSKNAGGEHVEVEVSDNGIGFEMEQAEAIFEVFRRLHGRAEYSGTGIGLALCRLIAREHRGEVRAAAQPGAGAQFVVRLQRRPSGVA